MCDLPPTNGGKLEAFSVKNILSNLQSNLHHIVMSLPKSMLISFQIKPKKKTPSTCTLQPLINKT